MSFPETVVGVVMLIRILQKLRQAFVLLASVTESVMWSGPDAPGPLGERRAGGLIVLGPPALGARGPCRAAGTGVWGAGSASQSSGTTWGLHFCF